MGLLSSILAFFAGWFVKAPTTVDGRKLVVTDGAISVQNSLLFTNSSGMRAVVGSGPYNHTASVKFTYQGLTPAISKLADGEIRSQFGLKLRARDACNLIYVMWRFNSNTLVVSVKSNPALTTSAQCGDGGYTNILPEVTMLPMVKDSDHTLTAALSGNTDYLIVTVDGKVVWQGHLGSVATSVDGPVGVRSDNAQLLFSLTAN